jgi:superfamily II DNA or RNA helicase
MISLLRQASGDLVYFLEGNLPRISEDWWSKHVIDRLSFQQQRVACERRFTRLSDFDFAALLRILDQNWFELGSVVSLPREARSWLKELQTVRNKWAHLGTQDLPPSEVYRDADTLARLLESIGADQSTIAAVNDAKAQALSSMAPSAEARKPVSSSDDRISQDCLADTSANPKPATLFQVGELVALRSAPATLMPIVEVLTGAGETRYRVFEGGSKRIYYQSQLQAAPTANDAREPVPADELRARMTSWQILSGSTSSLYSLRSGRVQFVPYQYRPVLKLIRADQPRILIADEVGVGKTIEAGLIIKELRARMDIKSVLVICPKALVAERKWFTEMKRFDEHFTALDGQALRHCLQETDLDGEWPESHSKAILPFSLFDSEMMLGAVASRGKRRIKGLTELEPAPQFDLVIVDEAHHIRNSDTILHQGIRAFCDNAQAVVLLTATPVQLGSNDLFTLLNVLRPELVIDRASFDQMAAPNGPINEAIRHCRAAAAGWQRDALTALDEALATDWGRHFLRESPAVQGIYDQLRHEDVDDAGRVSVIREIEELYTFSPLINRTRRRDIGEFTTRKPDTLLVEFTPAQAKVHDELLDILARILGRLHGQQNVKFMMTTIRRQAASCLYGLAPLMSDILQGKLDQLEMIEATDRDDDADLSFVEGIREEVRALLNLVDNLDPHDPKIEAFKKAVTDKAGLPNNKSLVFTTFRHTLSYIAAHMQGTGLRFGVVHGAIPDDERAELRHRFSLPKDDPDAIDVLLSSEVGCEGLDFQFCDMLVNYDLPWNPMRIEQRIGRIDRYGQQSQTVAIVNLVTPGTVDADIYQRCLWRIGVFQHAVGGSEEILGEITREIHDIAESFVLSDDEKKARLQQLSDNAIRRVREEEDLENRQSELFGLDIPKADWLRDVAAAETFWLSPEAVQSAVTCYLSAKLDSTSDHILGAGASKTLRLSQEHRNILLADYARLPRSSDLTHRDWEKWLKGTQPTLSVTFDQSIAAADPKTVHLSILHPLVRQAAQYFDREAPQYCSIELISPDLPSGTFPFAIYQWSKHGVREDEQVVAVANDTTIEAAVLDALITAGDDPSRELPDQSLFDALEERHYAKWIEAQANHVEINRQLVEHRVQSLTASHKARMRVIENQIAATTNEKIRIMRQAELVRANADFDRRMVELQQAAESGDIRATPIVFGSLTATRAAA